MVEEKLLMLSTGCVVVNSFVVCFLRVRFCCWEGLKRDEFLKLFV